MWSWATQTNRSIIVEMLQPYKGRVYDPAMGSGGFFVQSERFIEEHQGKLGNISVYGQESNPTTWRLAAMNMAIRGIDFNFGKVPANSFTNDKHPDLRADYVMANPPFNMKEWWDARLEGDPRWQYGTPPKNNANFAWMQHMLYHLAPNGSMALLLANGSMSSNTNNEGQIRKNLLEHDLVECMVALPGQLFTNTQIPACIWFLTKNKKARSPSPSGRGARGEGGFRDRSGEVLFIDARNMGYMKDRVLRDFKPEDIRKIADAYHAWQTNPPQSPFAKGGSENPQSLPPLKKGVQGGFIKTFLVSVNPHHSMRSSSMTMYSRPAVMSMPLERKTMVRLTAQLKTQFEQSNELEGEIKKNLAGLGYEF